MELTFFEKRKDSSKRQDRQQETADIFEVAKDINLALINFSHDKDFNGAHASTAKRHVCVRYHSQQEPSFLNLEEAKAYLQWLTDGNVGPHWKMKGR